MRCEQCEQLRLLLAVSRNQAASQHTRAYACAHASCSLGGWARTARDELVLRSCDASAAAPAAAAPRYSHPAVAEKGKRGVRTARVVLVPRDRDEPVSARTVAAQ